MEQLRLSLFGGVSIRHGEVEVARRPARGVQALLAYLLLQPSRAHPREEVMDALWPDVEADQARGRLNTAVWRLRQVLEPADVPAGSYLVTSRQGDVGFNWQSDHVLDTRVFENKLQRALGTPLDRLDDEGAATLEAGLDLYSGDLLPGSYDDWILRERERLRALYIDGLYYGLKHLKARGENLRALRCGQRILDLDPLREEVHREMMRLYLRSGQRSRAIRQYQACRQTLQSELGIGPMAETAALHGLILQPDAAPEGDPDRNGVAVSIDDLGRHIESAIDSFRNAELALQRILPLVEHLGRSKSNPRS